MVVLSCPRTGVQMVPLRDITADPALNPRAGGTPEDVAREYAEDMEAGQWDDDDKDPPVVFRDRLGKMWLGSGFIRRRAHELADRPSMRCDVREGDRRAAALWAAQSNKKGILRRSPADKERAVEIVLRECPDWTDRRIAEAVGVSPTFVGNVRRQLSTVDSSLSPPTRTGSDGRTRALPSVGNVSNARPPVLGPHLPGDVDADDGLCRLDAACLALGEVADYLDYLFKKGEDTDDACAALETLRALLWGDRPGKPPGA